MPRSRPPTPRLPCAMPGCHRVAVRRGYCGTHYRASLRADPSAAVMVMLATPEEEAIRTRRQRNLRLSDALLATLEAYNLLDGTGLAEPHLVSAYHLLGGPGFVRRRPSTVELHAAVLELQEQWVRAPVWDLRAV